MHIALIHLGMHRLLYLSCPASIPAPFCTMGVIGSHAKRAENKWKTKMTDIGLGQVDLPRGGMCLQGCA